MKAECIHISLFKVLSAEMLYVRCKDTSNSLVLYNCDIE
jgi:hypothetical protein